MKRFKNILLLYECDRATLERAAALAKNNRARLTVLHVIKEMPVRWRRVNLGGEAVDLQSLAIKEYQTRLKEFVAPLKEDGVRVSTKVRAGTPFLEISREVIGNQRDLVMMTAESTGGLKERLFGGLSLQLMRECPSPVWIMKPARTRRFPRILAAVDPDSFDETRDSLNATILQLASSLAAQEKAELHVIHAWSLLHANFLRMRGGIAESEIRNFATLASNERRLALHALLSKHTDGKARVHLIEGETNVVIPQFAKAQNIDLLVMGTVCRTGIPGFFIGNTAESILEQVDCSVLTVKPEGYVSPVKIP